ncbi:MAG: hypothetical protein IRZ15_04980 [Bryobacteraceae bacterium]|nr:hypothetical protein [Bryobacteraceae bacterium]
MKRFVLWDYPRASWQYDVMVILILAFVFLTPREWFRDRPRQPNSGVVTLPAEAGTSVHWVEPSLLAGVSEEKRFEKASDVIRREKRQRLVRLEPLVDSDNELRGFMAYTRP